MNDTATAATGVDFNDAADELGDDVIAEAINNAEPQAKIPLGFTLNSKGLFLDTDDGARQLTGPFKVLAQTRDRYSQAWGLLIQWKDDDGEIHRLSIARSLLAGDGREVRQALLHGGLYVSPFTKDRNGLQTFLASVRIVRRARAVSRVGWQDGAFALPDRTIDDGSGDLVVYQGNGALEHEFRADGTLDGWKEGVAALAAGNSRLVVAISAAFVGPLLAAVGAEGGGLHFRGPSSIGKSTALNAAASVWGAPSYVRQWRATANGLEAIAEQSNDCLLLLDELAQLDSREAGIAAYLLANGTGKARASQTGEARASKRWLTFFLSSGEISLAEHARSDGRGRRSPAGQEVRILDIEADAGKGLGLFDSLKGFTNGDELARKVKDNAACHYGHAGPEFVRRLLGDLENVSAGVRVGIDRFAASHLPANSTGQVSRACRRFGLIAIAGELATARGILPWKKGEAAAGALAVFESWLEARGGIGAAEDNTAIEQVAEFISTHGNSRFQPIDGSDNTVIHNRAGFKRETGLGTIEYLIPAATWRNEVCRGLNAKSVAATLIEKGHLTPDCAGKASRTETLPGLGKTRCYVIDQSIFGGTDV